MSGLSHVIFLNCIYKVYSYFLWKTARTGLQSLYLRLPVCADLIWNKDRDELLKKYLEQMDEYLCRIFTFFNGFYSIR